MKKTIWLTLLLLLALMLPITAQAAPRYPKVVPSISFSGTTATCKVTVRGDSTSDGISLTPSFGREASASPPGRLPAPAP